MRGIEDLGCLIPQPAQLHFLRACTRIWLKVMLKKGV